MVVLEEGSMLTTGHNQYLQPDYLSPLPTMLDAKKSPLALLAQTCSQIGADSPTKPLLSSLDKPSKGSSAAANARSPPAAKLERTRGSPADGKSSSGGSSLAFKPYETNVVSTKRSSSGDEASSRPGSKASSVHSASRPDSANNSASDETNNNNNNSSSNNNNNNNNNNTTSSGSHRKSASRSTPQGRKSASPAQPSAANSSRSSPSAAERRTPAGGSDRDKSSASPRNNSGASPIIRSGMEILHGSSKDAGSLQSMYKSGSLGGFGASSLCCPPGLAENPAFRPAFGGASAFSHHHAAAAAALLGSPGAGGAGSPGNNPHLSYARVKTPSGGETLVPVCKDPFCTGCQYSMHNAQMMMAAAASSGGQPGGSACPSGCTQCDHQKYSMMALSSLGPMAPPPSLAGYPAHLAAAAAAAAAAASGGRPHVCSWMAGDSFCGKRFSSGEELLQHLRSHTSTGSLGQPDPATTAALLAGQHSHPLLSSTAALHRAAAAAAAAGASSGSGSYPAPSLSPLSARYHPYGKPPTGPPLPASLAASPYSAFNPLGPYYSPYAIYGQRLGAAVHP